MELIDWLSCSALAGNKNVWFYSCGTSNRNPVLLSPEHQESWKDINKIFKVVFVNLLDIEGIFKPQQLVNVEKQTLLNEKSFELVSNNRKRPLKNDTQLNWFRSFDEVGRPISTYSGSL